MITPAAAGAVATAILSNSSTVLADLERTRALLGEIVEAVGGPHLPFALLRELFLETKYNLSLLDSLPTRKVSLMRRNELGRDPSLALVGHLQLDTLSAIVHSTLEFHRDLRDAADGVTAWGTLVRTPARKREQRWEAIAGGDHERPNLLGMCTTILLKVQVLRTLAEVPADATREIDAWTRLRNIHWLLRYLLRHLQDVVPEEEKPHVFGTAPRLGAT